MGAAAAEIRHQRRRGFRRRTGRGLRRSKASARIIIPAMQYPHCAACSSMKARLHRARVVDRAQALERDDLLALQRHHRRDAGEHRRLSISTVQAPHCPRPQPNFAAFSPSSPRSTYSKGVSGSTSMSWSWPLTFSFIGAASRWASVSRAACIAAGTPSQACAIAEPRAQTGQQVQRSG